MSEPQWTIDELARISGVSVRNIRYYVGEGLVPTAEIRGKFALYGELHLRMLRCILTLKAEYLPLTEIKQRLTQMTGTEMNALAERGSDAVDFCQAHTGAGANQSIASLGESAAEYIAKVRADQATVLAKDPAALLMRLAAASPAPWSSGSAPNAASISRLLSPEYPADPETWQRVRLTSNVEINYRTPLGDEEREFIDKLIAFARNAH